MCAQIDSLKIYKIVTNLALILDATELTQEPNRTIVQLEFIRVTVVRLKSAWIWESPPPHSPQYELTLAVVIEHDG